MYIAIHIFMLTPPFIMLIDLSSPLNYILSHYLSLDTLSPLFDNNSKGVYKLIYKLTPK